jgi:hypothetical protein
VITDRTQTPLERKDARSDSRGVQFPPCKDRKNELKVAKDIIEEERIPFFTMTLINFRSLPNMSTWGNSIMAY